MSIITGVKTQQKARRHTPLDTTVFVVYYNIHYFPVKRVFPLWGLVRHMHVAL